MKILYLSVHEILEADEVKMFHDLGHEVFSPGAYFDPTTGCSMRPAIPGLTYDPKWIELYNQIGQEFPGIDGKRRLPQELVDCFDVVIVMHRPEFISENWDVLKNKRVIWRTIGQSIASTEHRLRGYREQGMEIVRYSPKEAIIPGFIGQDALIRFGKDPNVYSGWTGHEKQVINFTQHMEQRGGACGWQYFRDATEGFERRLYEPGNNQPGFGMGMVPYSEMVQALRNSRVYLYTGTMPASYTLNFIEAWMTGIPIVSIGQNLGNGGGYPALFEVHELINSGVNGFVANEVENLRIPIKQLLEDADLAATIGAAGRQEAIRHFNVDMIGAAWDAYLQNGPSK